MFFNVKTKNEMIKITVIKNPTKTEHLHSFFIEYAGILKKKRLEVETNTGCVFLT